MHALLTRPLEAADTAAQDRWETLLLALGANVSLGPGWARCIAKSHDLLDRIEVVEVRRDGRSAILPLFVDDVRYLRLPLRSVEFLSNVVSYHAQPLADMEPDRLVGVLEELARERRAHVIRALNVRDDGCANALISAARARGLFVVDELGEESPYIEIDCPWDEFLGRRSRKFRANLTRTERQVGKMPEPRMRWFESPDDCVELLESIFQIEDASWKAAEGKAITQRPNERRYHEMLLPELARLGCLRANVLYSRGVPVAYVLAAAANRWVGQMKTSYDNRYRDSGAAVIDASVARAFSEGALEYDFLGNADPHKLRWTEKTRRHRNILLFLPHWRTTLARLTTTIVSLRRREVGNSRDTPVEE